MVSLRDYQQDLYRKTVEAMRMGYRKPLIVSPCGSGKSYLFAKMAEQTDGEVLVLTHRKELKAQHERLFSDLGISNARVSMVITENNHKEEHPKPRLIIADECHLSLSKSWQEVISYYDTYTIGLTATPCRLDGKPLGDIYDTMITGVDVRWLIEHQRLAPHEYYAPVSVNTDGLKVQRGDYVTSDIEKLMMDRAVYSDVLKSWESIAKNEKTIAYCVSIKHAKETAEMFREAGYPAVELDSNSDNRDEIMQDFIDGKYRILCNVGIISEGISIDDVTCCLLLRPTESLALYHQQGQRCMRYLPGKTAKIIDCVANYSRLPMFDADIEWSLDSEVKKPSRCNDAGNFLIRTCPKCFKVFKTAEVCPYCGNPYPLTEREIKNHEEIELRKITEEEKLKAEQARKQARKKQGMARSYEELVRIGKERGYKNPGGWAYMVMRGRR